MHPMTPEIGFVLILMLLWGPTALWLVYRAARGPRGRSVGFVDAAAAWEDRPQPAPDPADPTERPGEGWVCTTCHSVNRPRASRCYACGASPESGAVAKPAEVPTTYPGVAVMGTAAPVARPAMDGPTPRVPVAATSVAGTPTTEAAPLAPMPREPAPVAGVAVRPASAAVVARTSSGPATPVTPLPPMPAAVLPAAVLPAAAPDPVRTARAVPVIAPQACPFLGFKDDPSTRCDFPDARNVCHAPAPAGATWEARVRRLGSGMPSGGRSRVVDAAHQASHCLTPGHDRCPRFPEPEQAAAAHPPLA